MISALLVKAGITAAIVASAALAAQRLGPVWGGLVATLPVSAGPAYAMLGLQHPSAFVAAVAAHGLGANAATAPFLWVLVRTLPRLALLPALGLASLTWLVLALAILAWAPGFWSAAGLNALSFGLVIWSTRRTGWAPLPHVKPAAWWELPLRAVALGLLVAGVVSLSDRLGPLWTGVGAIYPVGLTTLTLVAVPRLGRQGAAALLAGAARGMPGFVLFMLVVALAAEGLGVAVAMALGIAAVLGWGGLVLVLRSAQGHRR